MSGLTWRLPRSQSGSVRPARPVGDQRGASEDPEPKLPVAVGMLTAWLPVAVAARPLPETDPMEPLTSLVMAAPNSPLTVAETGP